MERRRFLDYLYPPRCPVCDCISAEGVCEKCKKALVYIREDYCLKCGKPLTDSSREYCMDCVKRTHAFTQGRSLFSYQGEIRKSLYRLKYVNKREYADSYGEELAEKLGTWIMRKKITCIVPVPLHPAHRRKRGYNQAALLARSIGRRLGIPVEERLLYRIKKTRAQKSLSGEERRENMKDAFAVKRKLSPGERILLVDDIYTTGNTVDAAAKCLNKEERCRIYVLTVAIGG